MAMDNNITQPLKFLHQTYMTQHVGFVTVKNYFLNQQIDKMVTQTVESGLMNYWRSKQELKPTANILAGPKVLTMEQLGIGFKIFSISLLNAFLVFIFEILKRKVVDRLMKLF